MNERVASFILRLLLREETIVVRGELANRGTFKQNVLVTVLPQVLVNVMDARWYIRYACNITSSNPGWCFMHRLPVTTLTVRTLIDLLQHFGFTIERNDRDQEDPWVYRATHILWYQGSVVGSIATNRKEPYE